jgi:diacylglycerol O-acyltransferase
MASPIPMLDLMFFLTETPDNPRHVGAVLLFERPKRGGARVVLEIVDAYRRSTPVPPFNRIPVFRTSGLPEWQEVEALDMEAHVQHMALPAPGTDAQLHQLVAELHAPMLERSRPGWKVFVIDGLERERFAVFVKVHHALVDGESGIELVQRSLSRSPRDKRIRSVLATRLEAPPKTAAKEPTAEHEGPVSGLARTAVSVGLGALRLAEETLAGLRGFSTDETRPFTAPLTPMNEPIHNARAITHVMIPLAAMKSVSRAWSATLNDVALCVLDAAMNRYLRELRKAPDRPLVAICPVSLQDKEAKRASTEVSIFWTPLGTPTATLARRMREVIAHTREAKQRIHSLPKDVAYAYSVLTFAIGETLALVPRQTADFFLPANVLISNVRGPDEPLYLNGARLEALCPVSTLISGMGLNITFMSYAGQVVIGFTANAAAMPDVAHLGRYTLDAFAALERQSRRTKRNRVTQRVAKRRRQSA